MDKGKLTTTEKRAITAHRMKVFKARLAYLDEKKSYYALIAKINA